MDVSFWSDSSARHPFPGPRYQALLKDLNKIRDEIDEERKALQRKFYEMGQEFKRQKTVYEQRLREVTRASDFRYCTSPYRVIDQFIPAGDDS